MKVKVGVAQYEVPLSTEDSIKKLTKVATSAAFFNVKILVAPETAIGMLGDVKKVACDYLPELVTIAKHNKIYIATSFYQKENGNYYNQGYIVSD